MPTTIADRVHQASKSATSLLTQSLIQNTELDLRQHKRESAECREAAADARKEGEKAMFNAIHDGMSPAEQKRLKRSQTTGNWLTTMPTHLNGTELSRQEWRDSARPRAFLPDEDLPDTCDGCQQPHSRGHAMACKKGGRILHRHNDLVGTIHDLCVQAHTKTAVTDEPLIHPGRDAARCIGQNAVPELRGDLSVRNFWSRGQNATFDVRITDTEAQSHRGRTTAKCLEANERSKKAKHLEACLANGQHFAPLVFTVDGVPGKEAKAFTKHLAAKLAAKWKREHSETCTFVRARLQMALVRSTSLCLRGTRNHSLCRHPAWEGGSGLALYNVV